MKNVALITLSVLLAAGMIAGWVLFGQYKEMKTALRQGKEKIGDLNKQVAGLTGEQNRFKVQMQRCADDARALKKADEQIAELDERLKDKDRLISEWREKLQNSEKDLKEVNQRNEMLRKELSDRTQKNAEIEQELKRRIGDLKEKESLTETQLNQLKSTYDELVADLKDQIQKREATIRKTRQELTVTFVDRILFDFGKAVLRPEGKETLQKVGGILEKSGGKKIRIVGHTDNVPIMPEYRYKFPSNWELSTDRAAAVVRYFQKEFRIDPGHMEAVGRSFHQPVAGNDTDQGRALNRRVEIIIAPELATESKEPPAFNP
jgi:chemotaxis protein MotB